MKFSLLLLFTLLFFTAMGQTYVTRDIKSFGARGDGKRSDHAAFQKAAAFFNARGGNGKLVISRGTYLVGKQIFNAKATNRPVYEGSDVLSLTGVKNMVIEGQRGASMKFANGLRFGAFDPQTGKVHPSTKNFVNLAYQGVIGSAIVLTNCTAIEVKNLVLDGNSKGLILGGVYGDVGRQLSHMGIYIVNSSNVTLDNVKANHFGLDGIQVKNSTGKSSVPDKILLQNCSFEYNARQGLSWVGGNDLTAIDCAFNHTGKGRFSSSPGAGVDIEAEEGTVHNGKFIRCEFINNSGVGLVADSGPSRDCTFTDCTFWGTTSWSIWINKPGFTITNSRIYGSIVHGYDSPTDEEATKFISCHFEDKPYKGMEVYSRFLIETNGRKRVRFEDCTMVANTKKLLWMDLDQRLKPEEKYQLINCRFLYLGGQPPAENWIGVVRSVRMKNCVFEIRHPKAKEYYISGLGAAFNVNAGGNRIIVNGIETKL